MTESTRVLQVITEHCEWLFRIGILAFSIYQFWMNTERAVNVGRCYDRFELLKQEAAWLNALAVVQIVKVVIFSLWHVQLRPAKSIKRELRRPQNLMVVDNLDPSPANRRTTTHSSSQQPALDKKQSSLMLMSPPALSRAASAERPSRTDLREFLK